MNLDDFLEDDQEKISKQIRLRIRLSVFAYAYEFANESLIPDSEFDALCLQVDPSIETGNAKMDKFFKEQFNPSTGQWIHRHPELEKIVNLYKMYYS
jgi:NAD-dependent DNA ligase